MIILGSIYVAIIVAWHANLLYQKYTKNTAPYIVLGLWSLGIINLLAGLMAYWMDEPLGVLPLIAGSLSIEFATVLDMFSTADTDPNWNLIALRASSAIFFIGLFVVYA